MAPTPAQNRNLAYGDPQLFVNRDVSLLEFNRRVLAQALDVSVPLLERLRFLTISSSNLDEFFEVRAASHREASIHGASRLTLDGRTPEQTLTAISEVARVLIQDQYAALNHVILPALADEGIRLVRRSQWTAEQAEWALNHFRSQVLPVLTPIGLDPAHPFPRILNKSLNFIVVLEGDDAFGRDANIAIVQVPRALPRVLRIPGATSDKGMHLTMLSSIIHAHVGELFGGMTVNGCHQFRVTRNGDLWVDEEEVENLLQALRGELPERQFADAVRLELANDCPDELAQFLLQRFDLTEDELYRVDGPVNLHRLSALLDMVDRPELKYPPFIPRTPKGVGPDDDIFATLRAGDVLLHHPYESFGPVVEFLRRASEDPDVLAIKQTLYRTGADSPVVAALMAAARAGKQVTAVVELRARFDEARNIGLATQLQEVGASVVYGIVGYKTHAKMLMVIRRERGELRRYCHLGTGNYHSGTARAYTDISYLTSRPELGEDVHRVFLELTGLGEEQTLHRILQSPFTLRSALIERINAEADAARNGQEARIVAKMNALTEPKVIQALYRASQAGVKVDLIVRGACCLRPGVQGLSENIRVRSVLGRFLEHSRLYWFHAQGAQELFASSADWMSRNLKRRVETCFPIEDEALRARLTQEDLFDFLNDDIQIWEMRSDGTYERSDQSQNQRLPHPQDLLLQKICGSPDAEDETGLPGQV